MRDLRPRDTIAVIVLVVLVAFIALTVMGSAHDANNQAIYHSITGQGR